MQTINVDGLELSRLCLGGGKMTEFTLNQGIELIDEAIEQGINVFDAHHRYGNCEIILGDYPPATQELMIMTKISAYKTVDEAKTLIQESITKLGREPDIYWVSDLDNEELYKNGEFLYEHLRGMPFNKLRIGITTESAELGRRFMLNHPECNFFMLPLNFDSHGKMISLARDIKSMAKYVFVIKPFNDGQLFDDGKLSYVDIKSSFEIIKPINPDVICFGTKNIEHLKQTVEIFNEVMDGV